MPYALVPELKLRKTRTGEASATTVLLGAWVTIVDDPGDGFLLVRSFGEEGWVSAADVADETTAIKLFFVDVGQGDGVLIETPSRRILVDGGQHSHMHDYLAGWKYRWLLDNGENVHIDAIVVSHFDADHFAGLTHIIEDQRFTVGAIYHNGIPRFERRSADRPAEYDTDLGTTRRVNGVRGVLETTFSTLADAQALLDGGGLMTSFREFLRAAAEASAEGRLETMSRLALNDAVDDLDGLGVEVLGPVTLNDGSGHFDWFTDSSHTRNGHSLVLRLTWGERTFLLGGDLNVGSEDHLLAHVPKPRFRSDVAKACHHGSSEFTKAFLQAVCPILTVISSGDQQNYGHPQPDAVGAIGKYSAGSRPLIFSTELARSPSARGIHYGLINVRSNGNLVVGAQMFEQSRSGDMWNSFAIEEWANLDRCACDP